MNDAQPIATASAPAPAPASVPALRLLGMPALQHPGGSLAFAPERRFQLLALVALQGGGWLRRERLAALLWPGSSESDALRNLRAVIHRTRALPGTEALQVSDHALRWPIASDVQAFEAALTQQRPAAALASYGGALLEGMDDDANPAWSAWLQAERQRLAEGWHAAAAAQLAVLSTPAEVVALAARMLAADPLDEAALAALLRAEVALGQGERARRHYEAYARRLAEELAVEPSRALQALLQPPPRARTAAAAPPGPAPGGRFVGRRQELAQLLALLTSPDCRWLTLLGPGGTGKSRLAREALPALAPLFPGGRHWIDLQDLQSAAELLPPLARQLGVEVLNESDALAQLAGALPAERALLVLDNAEHLTDLPAMLSGLLARAPSVCVLLTTRSRLHGALEWLLPLPGLAVPEADSRDYEAAAAFDAVQLFAERARAADPRFELRAHLAAVIETVELLDGMPLAVELAAGWVRLMPPAEIARELRSSLDLLQRHPAEAAAPARPEHSSMRRVLERSVGMLAEPERRALAAISVFQGGFTAQAARVLRSAPLPLLSALVDKSLLTLDGPGRFRVHPLVQALAAERLAQQPADAALARQAHLQHFAAYMAALVPLTRGDIKRLIAAVEAEFGNVQAAWREALATGSAQALGDIVRALWVFFEMTGRLQEGMALLRPALAVLDRPGDATAAWALSRLRHGLSMLLHRGGHQEDGLAIAEAGVAGAAVAAGPAQADFEAHVGCILNAGSCLWAMGQLTEAHARFGSALALARAHGDRHCTAWALGNLAVSHAERGELDLAVARGEEALAADREMGNAYQVAVHLINLGSAHRSRDDLERAIAYTRQALDHALAHDLGGFANFARGNLASTLLQAGRHAEARSLMHSALASARADGLRVTHATMLALLARIETGSGNHAAAQDALRVAVRLAQTHGMHIALTRVLDSFAHVLQMRGEPVAAARVLQTLIEHPNTPPVDAQAFGARRDGLGVPPAAGPPLTLDDVLSWVQTGEAPA